jgi:hypothetical protein
MGSVFLVDDGVASTNDRVLSVAESLEVPSFRYMEH